MDKNNHTAVSVEVAVQAEMFMQTLKEKAEEENEFMANYKFEREAECLSTSQCSIIETATKSLQLITIKPNAVEPQPSISQIEKKLFDEISETVTPCAHGSTNRTAKERESENTKLNKNDAGKTIATREETQEGKGKQKRCKRRIRDGKQKLNGDREKKIERRICKKSNQLCSKRKRRKPSNQGALQQMNTEKSAKKYLGNRRVMMARSRLRSLKIKMK